MNSTLAGELFLAFAEIEKQRKKKKEPLLILPSFSLETLFRTILGRATHQSEKEVVTKL